jgi:hypothetical protein
MSIRFLGSRQQLRSRSLDRKVARVPRSNYPDEEICLAPGRYRVFGFPPMTGLALDKWIEVTVDNPRGCYGSADIAVHQAIPNITRIEDESGTVVWPTRT